MSDERDNLFLVVGVRKEVCMMCVLSERAKQGDITAVFDLWGRIDQQEDFYICDDHMDQWESSPEYRGEA